MWFFRDIVFPIVLVLFALTFIVFILNFVLRLFNIDIPIIRFVGLIGFWYYVGPVLYNWLITNIIIVEREGIRILYMPIQVIIEAFEKLV